MPKKHSNKNVKKEILTTKEVFTEKDFFKALDKVRELSLWQTQDNVLNIVYNKIVNIYSLSGNENENIYS